MQMKPQLLTHSDCPSAFRSPTELADLTVAFKIKSQRPVQAWHLKLPEDWTILQRHTMLTM